jgi:hypothetical protein
MLTKKDLTILSFFNMEELCDDFVIELPSNSDSINVVMEMPDFRNMVTFLQTKQDLQTLAFTLGKNDQGGKLLRVFYMDTSLMFSKEINIVLIKNHQMPTGIHFKLKGYFESRFFLKVVKNLILKEQNLRLNIYPEDKEIANNNEEDSDDNTDDVKMLIQYGDPDWTTSVDLQFKVLFELDEQWVRNKFKYDALINLEHLKRFHQVFLLDNTKKYILGIASDRRVFFQVYNTVISSKHPGQKVSLIESMYGLDDVIEV